MPTYRVHNFMPVACGHHLEQNQAGAPERREKD